MMVCRSRGAPSSLAFRAAKLLCRAQFQRIRLAFFSTDIVGEKPILVRDFIRSALYDPNHGYFSKRSGPVGVLDRSIRFNQLEGRSAYIRHLNNLYKQHDIAWFTPVELFKPWYAYGIAEAIMHTANLSIPLKIFEIGGGSGTCAKCILDYMMLNAPAKVYNNMTYTSIEISPSLAERQLETVGEVQSHLSRYKVQCRDATDRSGWGHIDPQPCWVIMLEVLDNLPHDLVYSPNQVSPWMEVWLEKVQDSLQISEVYKPLQDPLITQCVKIIGMDKDHSGGWSRVVSASRRILSKVLPKPRRAWMPTSCLKLLEVLHWALPKMSLIASDFSYLPDVSIPGDRAPLVSSKIHGSTVDHSNYLDAKGDADIFFPTDFRFLERIDHHCSGWLNEQTESKSLKRVKKRRTLTLDTAAFMEEFGLPTKTRTNDGYNPLLDDFRNTKFYISVPTHNIT
ncbi:protein arginine methyltransferase NDUFAF7 homolog, mitochondrial isoform X2 [Phoenix dactylifera]|uniref:Protein arginine methyltransferase NDUFAF7 n=1 Tax=Phoenix dactylifera TaxID=42345 RepID=A0A8B7BY09_PHODC|nr:protein arginine methyltransferase NDUFAF7 homolog, mitochondrial isoform X2 [Phoenix dactylifera]